MGLARTRVAPKRRQSPPPFSCKPSLRRTRPAVSAPISIPPCSTFLLLFALLVFSPILSLPQSTPSLRSHEQKPNKEKTSPAPSFRLKIPFTPSPVERGSSHEDLDWGDEDDGHYEAHIGVPAKQTPLALPETPQPLGIASPEAREKFHHIYRPDGLMELVQDGPHPVYELIQSSEKRWKEKLNRASTTLQEAVEEYRRRYHRMPPKGFEKWWRYVESHNVQLPDEYDQIHHDLEPFWGMSPTFIQDQQRMWEKDDEVGSYTIVNEGGQIFLAGHTMKPEDEEVAIDRAMEQLRLLEEVQEWLPDFRATFTAHDVPYQFIGHDLRSEAVDHAGMSEYMDTRLTTDFENHQRGWGYACPETSPLREYDYSQPFDGERVWKDPKTFIFDHKLAMNPCQHVSHVRLNGFLRGYGEGPVPRKKMVPAFSMSTTELHADILTVAMEMWTDDVGDDPEWKDKAHDKLLWRGRNTGTLFREDGEWKDSQRVRLVKTTNELEGHARVLNPTSNFAEPASITQNVPLELLNQDMMDIAFTGEVIQCEPRVCKEVKSTLRYEDMMTFEEANNWKYIIDVDGNGWSARFQRLMTSNSLVFKSTIFPEWYTDRIQPWVHYIPIKNDFTDLYDVFTFFHGDVDGKDSHDDLAESIAKQGKQWSLSFWRKEDMVAYMFRLFLEYARVMSRDREAHTFKWEDIEETI